jgi:hypothetical protein
MALIEKILASIVSTNWEETAITRFQRRNTPVQPTNTSVASLEYSLGTRALRQNARGILVYYIYLEFI